MVVINDRTKDRMPDVVCSVCGSLITLKSPVSDLCESCFEKEVMLSHLIKYLQDTDIKNLNKIQSFKLDDFATHSKLISLLNSRAVPENAYLLQLSNGNKHEIVRPVTVFGRNNEKSNCVINNSAMSGAHAIIYKEKDGYYIQDNNSSNGTWLNHRRLQSNEKCQLKSEDSIRFANENMTFIIV